MTDIASELFSSADAEKEKGPSNTPMLFPARAYSLHMMNDSLEGGGLSPFVNKMIGYSPAHLDAIKVVIRATPQYQRASFQDTCDFRGRNSAATHFPKTKSRQSMMTENDLQKRPSLELPGAPILQNFGTVEMPNAAHQDSGIDNDQVPKSKLLTQPDMYVPDDPCVGSMLRVPTAKRIWAQDRFGNTRLHFEAVRGLDLDSLDNIILAGEDINATNTAGETFLHVLNPATIRSELGEILQHAAFAGFDFHSRDCQGDTCIHALVRRGAKFKDLTPYLHLLTLRGSTGVSLNDETLSALRKDLPEGSINDKCTPDSINYDKFGDPELLRYVSNAPPLAPLDTMLTALEKQKANVNHRDRVGCSALHLAAALGCIAITKYLLENGANVHARDKESKGVLAAINANLKYSAMHPSKYGRILACKALVTDAGAKSKPTKYDEWDTQEYKRSYANTSRVIF